MALSILIAGGGIAGCAVAIALTAAGHRVRVVERQPEWRFQSSGIFVYANGLESFAALGVLEEMLAAGFAVPGGRNAYLDHHGAPIVETVYPVGQGRIPAILGIRRAEMHRVLAARMAALGVRVDLGTAIAAIDPEVRLSDGTEVLADLIVGADGLRSATRRLIGIEAEPRYTGFGVWRSVHARPEWLTDKIMMMGPAKRFGIMPISADRLYTFGTVAEPAGVHYPPGDWPALMRERFAGFGGPAAPFLAELDDAEVLFTAVEEVALPLPWHRGRVLLIGDAAHASTPFMGQGGAMALADAVALGQVLRPGADIDVALTAFGEARFPVCKFVQDASRAVGEAGAREEASGLAARNVRLAAGAQAAVDGFHARLAELNAAAEARLAG